MTDALSVGWTRAQAATQHTVYRRVLGFALIVQTLFSLVALAAPVGLAEPRCRSPRRAIGRLGAIVGDHAVDHGDPVSAGPDPTGLLALAQCCRHYRALRPGGDLFLARPRAAMVRAL